MEFNKKGLIIKTIIFFIFVGCLAAAMTSCAMNIRNENEKKAQIAYTEIQQDYNNKKWEDAQKKLAQLKKDYKDANYTQKALEDFNDIPNQIEKEKEAKKAAEKEKLENIKSKMPELLDSYNNILSQNKGKAMYSGVRVKNGTLMIFVNDYWNLLSVDVKKGWIKSYMQIWMGMQGARDMNPNANDWKLEVRHNASDRVLGTWDPVWGSSVKE